MDGRQMEATRQLLQEIQSRIYLILSGSGTQFNLSEVLEILLTNGEGQASLQRQVSQLRHVTGTDGIKHRK